MATTAKKSTAKKPPAKRRQTVIDLTEDVGFEEIDDDDLPTKTVKFLDEEFTVYIDLNTYLLNEALGGNLDAIHQLFEQMFPADDYRRFNALIGRQRGFDDEKLARLFSGLIEVVSERPTN